MPAPASRGVAQAPAATTASEASTVPAEVSQRTPSLAGRQLEHANARLDGNAGAERGERAVGADGAAVQLEHDLAL